MRNCLLIAALLFAVAPQATVAQKVTICHGTNSDNKPYNKLSISESALKSHFENGHAKGGARKDAMPGDSVEVGGVKGSLDAECTFTADPVETKTIGEEEEEIVETKTVAVPDETVEEEVVEEEVVEETPEEAAEDEVVEETPEEAAEEEVAEETPEETAEVEVVEETPEETAEVEAVEEEVDTPEEEEEEVVEEEKVVELTNATDTVSTDTGASNATETTAETTGCGENNIAPGDPWEVNGVAGAYDSECNFVPDEDEKDDVQEDELDTRMAGFEEHVTGTKGDPHFVMWNGRRFSFHGGCDLVLVDNPEYNNGQGLKVHVRTRVRRWFSYVESAVVQIGQDRFEAMSGFKKRRFWVNGHRMPGKKLTWDNGVMPFKIGGNPVRFQVQQNGISWKFTIELPEGQSIAIRTVKEFMRVDIAHPAKDMFVNSRGLMGTFEDDRMLARDGQTVMDDEIMFGQEWQVQLDEDMLFHDLGEDVPHHPQSCIMPAVDRAVQRMLRAGGISHDYAEAACSHLDMSEQEDCIYDVIATNDVEIAGAY